MVPFTKPFFERPPFLIFVGLAIVTGALFLTAHAAPAVAERFVGEWGAISTVETERDLFKIRQERERRAIDEARRIEQEKKKILTHRGVARARIADHVPQSGKFIGIDLIEMTLTMFEDGKEVGTTTIISKGRPGSHWETPSGSYAIRTKEVNHFSSIGQVNMPYSMQFYGNFFIHGWPTYPGGEPVAEGYSGGCIRLSTEDAERVFRFASAGTPMFIYDTDAIEDEPVPSLVLGEVELPVISADAFVIADLDGGEILMERNAGRALPMASIAKLMTAIVANETISYDKKIEIVDAPEGLDAGGAVFPTGKRFAIGVLYQPLLNESSDQAALSMARYYGSARFVDQMNEKAKALGMKSTKFTDSTGIDPGNVSTADDLLALLTHLKEKKRFLLDITTRVKHTIISQDDISYPIGNNIPFADDLNFRGGKIGFTDAARETGVFLFRHEEEERTRSIAIVILGSERRNVDVALLRLWLSQALAQGEAIRAKQAAK